jgi:hypothetical protein
MAILRGGYSWLEITDPDAKQLHTEADCFACAHCGRITKVPPEVKHYTINICRKCLDPSKPGSGRVCDACYAKGTCVPLEKRLDEYERMARRERMPWE